MEPEVVAARGVTREQALRLLVAFDDYRRLQDAVHRLSPYGLGDVDPVAQADAIADRVAAVLASVAGQVTEI
jgi:hypothetical protein